jgi:uncharacterized protein (TIGR00730 family)
MKRLCVFCGSSPGNNPEFMAAARRTGRLIANRGLGLVYGGGGRGMMGAVADGALEALGDTIGVIPRGLFAREGLHTGLGRLEVVETMHERKALMAELSDGFVTLPGGIGTMEELFEIWTWTQIGVHGKPAGILNLHGYYDGLLMFLDGMVANGYLRPEQREVVLVDDDPGRLIERVLNHRPRIHEKWMDAQHT